MAKIRPYLAIDLETTGLDVVKSQILQVGWVLDDGVSPIDQLLRNTFFIENPTITYGENYALGMNAWIFQELMKKELDRKYPTATILDARRDFENALAHTSSMALIYDREMGVKRPSERIQLAGKNVAQFDLPILKNQLNFNSGLLDHRTIDVGSVFFEDFGKNPGFNDINKLVEYKDITHDALDDALNVVVALRFKANQKTGG